MQAQALAIEHVIRVSTYDIDFAGHVSNISYLRWLEDMRLMLFDKYFPLSMFMAQGTAPILRSTNIVYKRPIKLFDKPHGKMWVSGVSGVTITIRGQIFVDNQIATEAEHVGVFISLNSGRPVRVPDVVITKFHQAH